jgi:hypothetical protein
MKRLARFSFVLGAAVAAAPALSACYAETSGYIVEDPPPPREEVVTYRPGHIWVHGHWAHDGNRWAWRGGYYERERAGQVYVEGRWERRGNHRVWIEGSWRARG